jgi:hypothetical protein
MAGMNLFTDRNTRNMAHPDDLWYVAKTTRVVYAPPRLLETFGETVVRYFVLSEPLDEVGSVRIREGRVMAERPRVITPHFLLNQALVNFGEDARKYLETFLSSQENLRVLEYGLRFRKEDHSQHVVQGNLEEIAEQVAADAKRLPNDVAGVVIGVDDHWEISLLQFVSDLVKRSTPHNAKQMAGRGLLDLSSGGVPNAVRAEIESDFRMAEGNLDRLRDLGEKLRSYGLFDQYEDRFFALYRAAKG